MSNSNRFSDEKLEMFRVIILEKKTQALKSYKNYAPSEGNGTNGTSPTYKGVSEEGAESLNVEESNKLAGRQLDFVKSLDLALLRIGNKTFGKCHCPLCNGKLQPEERLVIVPHATKCVDAKKC